MFRFVVVALLLGSLTGLSPGASLSVSPHFSHPRDKVKATMFIPDSPDNREACLVWNSVDEAGRKCWEHNNEGDFPTGHFSYLIILHYPGTYEFQLQVASSKLDVTPIQTVEVLE